MTRWRQASPITLSPWNGSTPGCAVTHGWWTARWRPSCWPEARTLLPQPRRPSGQSRAGRRGGDSRRFPVAAYTAALAVGAAQVAAGIGPTFTGSPLQPTFADAGILILLYTIAAERPRRVSLPGLAACVMLFAAAVARYNPGADRGPAPGGVHPRDRLVLPAGPGKRLGARRLHGLPARQFRRAGRPRHPGRAGTGRPGADHRRGRTRPHRPGTTRRDSPQPQRHGGAGRRGRLRLRCRSRAVTAGAGRDRPHRPPGAGRDEQPARGAAHRSAGGPARPGARGGRDRPVGNPSPRGRACASAMRWRAISRP